MYVLFLEIASKRSTFIFDAPEFHIDYIRTPPPLYDFIKINRYFFIDFN